MAAATFISAASVMASEHVHKGSLMQQDDCSVHCVQPSFRYAKLVYRLQITATNAHGYMY